MKYEKGDWILKRWYHKTIYAIGWVWVVWVVFLFMMFFVEQY